MRFKSWMIVGVVLMSCLAASVSAETETLIGEHYAYVLNGITFIQPERAGFMVRIGWVEPDGTYRNDRVWINNRPLRHGPSAPDYSINDVEWQVGEASVRMLWSKTSPLSAACMISADKPVRITLEATPTWQTYASKYSLRGNNEITGEGQFAIPPIGESKIWYNWKLKASGKPVAKICVSDQTYLGELVVSGTSKDHKNGQHAALVYDLDGKTPLKFVAGFESLADLRKVERILNTAFEKYDKERVRAFGDWGKFLDPMMDQMGHNRLYDFQTHWVAPAVCRYWTRTDGVMFFVWDSFFNAQMYCLEDFEQAKIQLRAMFEAQQENGLLPLYSGARWDPSWDRSQPPVGAMCVWKIYQRWPDKVFLAEFYPKLKKWHDWWFTPRPFNKLPYRDGNQNGLLEWGTESNLEWQNAVWESGLDDSPMYDEAIVNLESGTLMLDDVGLSALWGMDAMYLAMIADELGYAADANRFRNEKERMANNLNKVLWNDEMGMYNNRYWNAESRLDAPMGKIITAKYFRAPDGKPGLKADYYNGNNFDTFVLSRTEEAIDYHCGPKLEGLERSKYTVRWSGSLVPEKSGEYTFVAMYHDGARMWIDGQHVLDDWKKGGHKVTVSKPIRLEAGKLVPIKVEHVQHGWRDQIKLTWHMGTPPEKSLFSSTISPMCFYPLIMGAPSKQQAARMLKILKDPNKFWGDWVMPTVPRDDPAYPDEHYWRGKIWPPSNYLVYLGLKNYAADDLREEFARKSIQLFMRNYKRNWSCHENFRNDGNGCSVPHYTWGALMCLMGLEEVCDIEPDGTIRLNGQLPENIKLRGIPILGKRYDIETKDGTAQIRYDEEVVLQAKKKIVKETIAIIGSR